MNHRNEEEMLTIYPRAHYANISCIKQVYIHGWQVYAFLNNLSDARYFHPVFLKSLPFGRFIRSNVEIQVTFPMLVTWDSDSLFPYYLVYNSLGTVWTVKEHDPSLQRKCRIFPLRGLTKWFTKKVSLYNLSLATDWNNPIINCATEYRGASARYMNVQTVN